jgi:iron complex transport system permease protein
VNLRASSPAFAVGFLILLLAGALLTGAGIGAMSISPAQVAAILAKAVGIHLPMEFGAGQEAVLLSIRLPRVLLGALVGGSLAIAGGAMQGLFRNPLADPGLLGVSSGAALAAFAAIVLGGALLPHLNEAAHGFLLPISAFAGGLGAILVIYALSREGGREGSRVSVSTMLMAGIAVNALCGAGIGLFAYLATDAQLRSFTFWSLGSLGGATWGSLARVAPVLLLAIAAFARLARPLNLLSLGETEAAHLGVPVERLKILTAALCALVVGAAVSVSGAIGFVGLVVPHLVRMTCGPDHRLLLPASLLGGASLLVAADVAARTWVAPAELPIGILTALVGGPFFLYLLARRRGGRAWT